MDGGRDPNAVQELDDAMIEVGDGSRLQRQFARLTPAGAHDKAMADKVKLGVQDFAVGRDRRRSKTSRADVERNLPAMVEPGRQLDRTLPTIWVHSCNVAAVSRQAA